MANHNQAYSVGFKALREYYGSNIRQYTYYRHMLHLPGNLANVWYAPIAIW
jgi:hypothetical protein